MPEIETFWELSYSTDPVAREIADRHYNRQKIGSKRFVPPGRCLVLLARDHSALWVTSFPFAEFVLHAWAGAWMNSCFRNEGHGVASDLIREAVAITHWFYGPPPTQGMVTFIDPEKVPPSIDPQGNEFWGYSYMRAKFKHVGYSKSGLVAMQLKPSKIIRSIPPAINPDMDKKLLKSILGRKLGID